MSCTPTQIAAYEARLVQIETALADLALGKRVVKLSADGESVEYAQANRADLLDLQTRTQMALNKCTGAKSGWGRSRMAY